MVEGAPGMKSLLAIEKRMDKGETIRWKKDKHEKPGGAGANSFGDFSSLGKTDDLKSGKDINRGGLRAVNITIQKFFDNNIVNVKSAEEGRTATGEKVAEGLLRICNSVGENLAAG